MKPKKANKAPAKPGTCVLVIPNFPKALRQRFMGLAHIHGVTGRNAAVDALERWVRAKEVPNYEKGQETTP